MTEKLQSVLVYGTLRPFTNEEIVHVPGYIYDLGCYPGIQLSSAEETDSRVVCERIYVTEEKLTGLDQYEGCSFGYPAENSLYTREKIQREDGGFDWIYVYSRYGAPEPFKNATLIESGDWQAHIAKEQEAA